MPDWLSCVFFIISIIIKKWQSVQLTAEEKNEMPSIYMIKTKTHKKQKK